MTTSSSPARPMTGDEYLESLRDGREIWIYGEKVDDVTTHPAFRNGARSVARLYDALHDPATKDVLTVRDGHRQRRLHAPVLPRADVRGGSRPRPRRDRRVAAADLRLDGPQPRLQGRVSRHLRAERRLLRAVTTRTRAAGTRRRRSACYFMNHTLVNPPVDRNREIHEVERRLHPRGQGDGRGRGRPRREDGRDRLGVLELQLRLLPRLDADQEGGVRALVLRADEPAGHRS